MTASSDEINKYLRNNTVAYIFPIIIMFSDRLTDLLIELLIDLLIFCFTFTLETRD